MSDSMLDIYIYENTQLLEQLEELLLEAEHSKTLTPEQIDEIFRIMHTIKGASAMMSYDSLTHVSHAIEDLFSQIRSRDLIPTDFSPIFDIVLAGADFLKGEIAKISSSINADGDPEPIIAIIREYLNPPQEAAEPPEAIVPESEPEPILETSSDDIDAPVPTETEPNIPATIGEQLPEGGKFYRAKVNFEPECKMENIRAFAIVNSLTEVCEKVEHIPSDLFSADADMLIAEDGVTFFIYSTASGDEIQSKFAEALFVLDVQFSEIDGTDISLPPGMRQGEAEEESPPPPPMPVVEAEVKHDEVKPSEPEPQVASAAAPAQAPAPAPAIPATAQRAAAQLQAADGHPEAQVKQSFISVNIAKLDKLMNLVGEIVTTESMVTKNPDLEGLVLDNFSKSATQLRKLTDELQDVVMSVRMVPVSNTFHKQRRIVRDMCKKINKEAELVIIGEDTEVDKNIIDTLSDPLMHIIRNSMDHGLETPKEREKAGKNPAGTIILEARNTGSDIMILISDDGQGLDRDRILKKAAERGILQKPESEISDREAYSYIMMPGFSTNEVITEFSGRGVGMDVVRKNIEKIGGTVAIDSTPGKGMTTTIKIPLTLAILDGMLIKLGVSTYIVPVLMIRDSFKAQQKDLIIDPDGNEMIMIRGVVYPIVRLHRLFGVASKSEDFLEGIMVRVENDDKGAVLFADELLGQMQVVIKPLPAYINYLTSTVSGLSGCTLMGNGSISLILDINQVLEMIA